MSKVIEVPSKRWQEHRADTEAQPLESAALAQVLDFPTQISGFRTDQALQTALGDLDPRSARVLTELYGLDGNDPRRHAEVAKTLNEEALLPAVSGDIFESLSGPDLSVDEQRVTANDVRQLEIDAHHALLYRKK